MASQMTAVSSLLACCLASSTILRSARRRLSKRQTGLRGCTVVRLCHFGVIVCRPLLDAPPHILVSSHGQLYNVTLAGVVDGTDVSVKDAERHVARRGTVEDRKEGRGQ